VSDWESRPPPAGFGVIAGHWRERALLAGTYDQAWSDTRAPLVPADFDIGHYQSVPADQQAPAWLHGGEPVALVNLTPSGSMRFALPAADIEMETRFMDGSRRAHAPPHLHTVIIQPDANKVSLVWHSAIECHALVYRLERTRIRLRAQDEEDEDVESLLDLV
jgi:hypothetical protein